MNVKSYAKINLSLRVVGRRENGYHDLEMVNLPIELHDILEISILPDGSPDTFVTCDDIRLNSMRANLCTKAIAALRAKYRFKENFRIHIHKEIPFAAGLGGGSSNAAATMMALNKLLKLGATESELAEIGLSLGADVPYFIYTKPAKVTGIGEIIEPIKVKKTYYCLIVKPEKGLSTDDVYKKCDSFQRYEINTDKIIEGLRLGDDLLIEQNMGNDLMPPASSLLPDVGEIYSQLRKAGFGIACMSGSGSSLFALSTDAKKVRDVYRRFEKTNYTAIVTKTM